MGRTQSAPICANALTQPLLKCCFTDQILPLNERFVPVLQRVGPLCNMPQEWSYLLCAVEQELQISRPRSWALKNFLQ